MSDQFVKHATFSLERDYDAPASEVFRAFSDPEMKARWFSGPEGVWQRDSAEMDFREGGREHSEGHMVDGTMTTRFDATYHEIVDGERIVYDYEMHVNGARVSISLASIELDPTQIGTHLTITEQGVYYDEGDSDASREEGTRLLLERIGSLFGS
ncbi:MAG: SRPBCC domain-containing protein [Acidimicrobiales bacterium]